MIPPADRIREQNEQDPGRVAHTRQKAGSNDFLAVGPALRILQLNVVGLSAAKRSIIREIAERHKRRRHLPLCTRLFSTSAEIYKIK